MKKEGIVKNKKFFVVGGILIAIILVLTGCGKKENDSKTYEKESDNQVVNIAKENENNTTVQEKNETKKNNNSTNNTIDNDKDNKVSENKKNNNASTNNNHKISSELVVIREGFEDVLPSKAYESSLGYTMRYSTEDFKASFHDNWDWFDRDEDINCVVVEKEDISYSKKIATLSNYKKTTINGYEAVYTTKKAEGQFETLYYVNTGKDYIYIITTSCQDSSEYLEGLGHIMDAMVQTFYIK